MSNIRRQSIISSFIVYFGFVLGLANTYFFTRKGGFTEAQYGLVSIFIAIANVMYSFASLGMLSFIYKFYPYYNDNLPRKKNDMISLALMVSMCGFSLVTIAGIVFKQFVIRKYGAHSPELITYYYWVFPFGLGLTIYSILEAYAWQEKKSVLTNFMREMLFRLFTTVLIVLFISGVISRFDPFIKIYSFTYILLAIILLIYLYQTKRINFIFSVSRVTRKFYRKIIALSAFVWSGGLVFNISSVFDTLVIAAVLPNGMAYAGIYSLAQNTASLIQAPQRGIISASIGPLSRAWKDKDYEKIRNIYQRSSINQLIFSVGMFSLIMMNFNDGIVTFSIKQEFLQAMPIFLFIGLMRILDMGTGLNSQIIATSVFWRFEFFTGIILLAVTLPMNYLLTKSMGVIGPAVSNLIAFTIYNIIRCAFLWRKMKMQPFSAKTIYALLLGIICYTACYFLFRNFHGLGGIMVRSISFIGLFGFGIVYLAISPDIMPVLGTIRKKLRI